MNAALCVALMRVRVCVRIPSAVRLAHISSIIRRRVLSQSYYRRPIID
jgi:hypothetical protein